MRKFIVTAFIAATTCITFAQSLSLPPQTVEGYLRNGMHYIIKQNSLPQHTVEFRLVMHVGSLQENDQQGGCAHFLEHMASNGTKQFPGRSMIDFFERQGMKYGRDINAFTGFDRTIYWFTVPIFENTPTVVDTTLMAIRGILTDIRFDEERTKKERGVILEELRSYDTNDPFYSLKIGDGRYSRRMPLGTEMEIKRIDRRILKAFYEQWYAPQFATLLVVGAIDPQQIEKQIESYFGDVPRRGASTLGTYSVGYPHGIKQMEIKDTSKSSSRIEFIIPHTTTMVSSIESRVEKARDEMLVMALNNRINAALIPCDVSDKWYVADQSHFVFSYTGANNDSLLSYVRRSASSIYSLAAEGPTTMELNELVEQKSKTLQADTMKYFSSKWCDDFIDYAIMGDRRIYLPAELALVKEGVAQTTPQQIQAKARHLLRSINQTLLLAYTNGSNENVTKDFWWNAWKRGSSEHACPYVPRKPMPKEVPLALPPFLTEQHGYSHSQILSEKTYQDLKVQEVFLSNGVRLLFRPTQDQEQRMQVTLLGRGGTAALNDDDYYRLRDAVSYMDMGGIEGMEPQLFSDIMGQHNISMVVGLEDQWHQLMASSDSHDAQLLFNIIYEKLHHPRKCYQDFEESLDSEKESFGKETVLGRMLRHDTDRMMQNCIDSLMGNVQSRRPMLRSDLEAMNLDDMASYYHSLYTNPHDLTVVITGNYDLKDVKESAIGTFARMQQPDVVIAINDDPIQPVRNYQRQFDNENPSQTILNYIFAGNYNPSLQTTLTFKLMRDLFQQRLLSVLRERENIVYSPYSNLSYQGLPQRSYYFQLTVAVKNENKERVQRLIKDIVANLQQQPVSAMELDKMKRSFVVTKCQLLNDVAPIEWKNVITTLVKNGESLSSFDNYEETLNKITPKAIQMAFRNYIDINNYILMCKAK